MEKRTGVACDECRKRKRKCDGLRPRCTFCTTSEKICEYAGNVETRKRKQVNTEYVSVLEEQISTLRAQVADLQQARGISPSPLGTEQHSPHVSEMSSAREHKSAGTGSARETSASSYLPETPSMLIDSTLSSSAIDDLSSLVWRMNIGEKGEPTFIGPSGNFCVPSAVDGYTIRSVARQTPQVEFGQLIPDVCYDNGIKSSLCNLFLKYLNPIHQFVPKSINLEPDLYPFDDLSRTMLHSAVFAAGALYSFVDKEREAGAGFSTHVDMTAMQACREHPSATTVQALTIAAWRELSLENNSCASIYLSMGGGLAISLGLHVIGLDTLSESKSSKILLAKERETRLRTFWSFFLLDRITTTLLGRNCVIPWRRVEVPQLYSVLADILSVDEMAFSHQCRLWQLFDNFMDEIYAFKFSALEFDNRKHLLLSARAELLAFKHAMPTSLLVSFPSSSSVPPTSVLFLQMSYQMSLLLIHRPYLRELPGSSSFTLALATMTSAATRLTQYIQVFYKHYLHNHPACEPSSASPFIVHHILTASIMHLLLGTTGSASHTLLARRKLQICMEVLTALEKTWSIASKAIAQIQEIAVQWKIVAVLPMKWSFVGDKARNEYPPTTTASETSVNIDSTLHSGVYKPRSDGSDLNALALHEEIDATIALDTSENLTQGSLQMNSQLESSTINDLAFDDYFGLTYKDENLEAQFGDMGNADSMLAWLDPQLIPDPSALQDMSDLAALQDMSEFQEFSAPL